MDAKVSIVMPAFNEEGALERSVRECQTEILARFVRGEILVVNDCSTDGTAAVLEALKNEIPELIIAHNAVNLGHGRSLIKALLRSDGDYVFVMDSDYQHLPGEFWRLFAEMKDAPIVTGLRLRRRDDYHRLVISKIANLLARFFFACPWRDLNIPFKLFSRHELNRLLPLIPEDSLIPSIMLMLAAARMGSQVRQVEVTHLPRATGMCSLPGRRLIFFCGRALAEMAVFRCTKWRRIAPSDQRVK